MNPTPHGLDVDVIRVASGVTFAVTGDLDMATAPVLIETAEEILSAGGGDLTVDLANVGFCDSAGINALIRLRQMSDQYGWRLQVVNPQRPVLRVLELTGLKTHLNIT